jgi:hypothetical protein
MELQCSNPACGVPLVRFAGRLRPVVLERSGSVLFLWTCANCVADEALVREAELPTFGGPHGLHARGNA